MKWNNTFHFSNRFQSTKAGSNSNRNLLNADSSFVIAFLNASTNPEILRLAYSKSNPVVLLKDLPKFDRTRSELRRTERAILGHEKASDPFGFPEADTPKTTLLCLRSFWFCFGGDENGFVRNRFGRFEEKIEGKWSGFGLAETASSIWVRIRERVEIFEGRRKRWSSVCWGFGFKGLSRDHGSSLIRYVRSGTEDLI